MALKITLETKVEEEIKKVKIKFKGKTQRVISPCDQGHYGSTYCGHCNYSLKEEDSFSYCPKCKYEFVDSIVDYPIGGSDF